MLLTAGIYAQTNTNENKQSAIDYVENNYEQLTALSDKIWAFEEIAFQETQSAAALIDHAKKQGFTVHDGPTEGTFTNYENLDNKVQGIHDYIKWLKFGYGRATDNASVLIRLGELSREEGLK